MKMLLLICSVYLIVVEDGAPIHLALLGKGSGVALKVVLTDKGDGRPYAGHDEEDDERRAESARAALGKRIGEGHLAEAEVLDTDVGGQHDEDAVDDKQVGSSQEIAEVAAGQTETGRAEGRHKGGGNSNTGKHGALLLTALLKDAGKAAEESYQHIIDGGVGAGKQFAGIGEIERSDEEVDKRSRPALRISNSSRANSFGFSVKQASVEAPLCTGAEQQGHF